MIGVEWILSIVLTAEDPKPAEPKESAPKLTLKKKSETDDAKPSRLDPEKSADPETPPVKPTAEPTDPKLKLTKDDKELLKDLEANLENVDDEEDPLLRAGKRMRQVEEKLARTEATDAAVALQQKAIEDLEELLKRKNDKDNEQQKKQQQQKQQKQQKPGEKKEGEPKPGQKKDGQQTGKQAATQARLGAAGREKLGKILESKDVWGHLNATLRQEMDQYAKETFLPKYRELLEKYYTTIAKQASKE